MSTPAERTEASTPAAEEDTSAAKARMSRTTGDLLFLFFLVEVGVAAGGRERLRQRRWRSVSAVLPKIDGVKSG